MSALSSIPLTRVEPVRRECRLPRSLPAVAHVIQDPRQDVIVIQGSRQDIRPAARGSPGHHPPGVRGAPGAQAA